MKPEVKSIFRSFIPGFIFVVILTLIKYYEEKSAGNLISFGLLPRSVHDLRGIITFPLIHKDYEHLFSNSIPLFILMALLRYFYKEMSFKVFTLVWILSGFWLWLGGRPAYHIGASGLVYGLSSFIFFSGVWRKERKTMAVSLIVVFLYGGMVWGLFPFFRETSWEGHLFGGLSGLLLSWVYRKEGPQRVRYHWEDEPEDPEDPAMGQYDDEIAKPREEEFDNLPEDGSVKEGDENRKMEEAERLKKNEKASGKDLFDLSSPKITYEYIVPEKKKNGNTDPADSEDLRG